MTTPSNPAGRALRAAVGCALLAAAGCAGDPGSPPDGPAGPDAAGLPRCEPPAPCALVLVDARRLDAVRASLLGYVDAVRARLGVSFLVQADAEYEWATPAELRETLRAARAEHGVVGAILVGRLPYRLWEHDWDGEHEGVNSFYYEDLDAVWSDTDGDDRDDLHGWGAGEGPEIWVSFLYPSEDGATADAELNFFFDKARQFHEGRLRPRDRGLVVIHSDWARDMDGYQDYFGQLAAIYGPDAVDRRGGYDDEGQPIPVDGDAYLALIGNTYETVVMYTHASSSTHATDTRWVDREEIAATRGGALLTFIGGCHSGDVREAGTEIALAPTYVFRTPLGLAATGTTWSYGPEELVQVTARLEDGATLGDAWLAKQRHRNTPAYYQERYAEFPEFDPDRHMFGEILFGDPFLTVR